MDMGGERFCNHDGEIARQRQVVLEDQCKRLGRIQQLLCACHMTEIAAHLRRIGQPPVKAFECRFVIVRVGQVYRRPVDRGHAFKTHPELLKLHFHRLQAALCPIQIDEKRSKRRRCCSKTVSKLDAAVQGHIHIG